MSETPEQPPVLAALDEIGMGWAGAFAEQGTEDMAGLVTLAREQLSERFARLAAETGTDLMPLDLEADCNRLWPSFAHDWLSEGDIIELKRDGQPYRRVRVTKVIPGPGGQVMYDTEPAGEDNG